MTAILEAIVQLLVSGISGIASGIGSGLQNLVQSLFLETVTDAQGAATTQLSTFGGVTIIFAGVSLAIGLCRWVTNWLTSLGN